MINFDIDEQRAFLQFVTGSPRLPVGGKENVLFFINNKFFYFLNRFSNVTSSINNCTKSS
jgi:hypothetical protein